MKLITIIKKILAWIIIVSSFPFLVTAIVDFVNTKDFIDIILFVLFSVPFFISVRCLFKMQTRSTSQHNVIKKSDNTPDALVELSQSQNVSPTPVSEVSTPLLSCESTDDNAGLSESILFPDWYISISFGKSSSVNYSKAVALAKSAPQYHEQEDDGKILHQAIYSSKAADYLSFIMLYETVKEWKSSFVIINGQLIDRKIIGQLNYCYGDKCRSGNPNFCYGASYMTDNPFGCHRLQISACNNPWWSFYTYSGNMWILDKNAMIQRINSYAAIYSICPAFDYNNIIDRLNQLPSSLSDTQYKKLIHIR